MRQTAEHHPCSGFTSVLSPHVLAPSCYTSRPRHGFTLIEVMVAMAILMIVMVSVFMLISVSATSLKNSEMLETAKNIGTYTVEYLRARDVTLDNNFINTDSWYRAADLTATPPDLGNASAFPGLVDLGSNLVEKNNLAPLSINTNPALSSTTYTSTSFYSSLQGYVSLADSPLAASPSVEDGNANVVAGKYYDRVTGVPYVVRFPISSSSSGAISNFTALAGYNAMIYSDDSAYTTTSSRQYDPHYTSTKANTTAYRGFRVLTQIAARAQTAGTHVQYYDVRVTVFWLIGSAEHSYSISTQITTYGGS